MPTESTGSTTPPRNNQENATSLLAQIPLGAIIGSPLTAAVEAQAAASRACYEFISNVGFEETERRDANGAVVRENGNAVMERTKVREITFVFERQSPAPAALPSPPTDGTTPLVVTPAPGPSVERFSVTVPLLTIMPLPFIRIDNMTINFKASIAAVDTQTKTDTSSTAGQITGDGTLGFGWWKLNVGGSLSSKKDSTGTSSSKYSVEHTMDITVQASQDHMPAGLAEMLSILKDNIAISPVTRVSRG
jgi:hypothetical protein